MDKRFLAILGVLIVGFLGFFIFTREDSSESSTTTTASVSNHSVGQGSKNVTLVEYGDFECPACSFYYNVVKQVKEKYGDQITFTFRHFPIDTIHRNARAASRAAEAASKQGKFFEMHDLLYENQSSWNDSSNIRSVFDGYATQIGLNMEQFQADYVAETTNETINADINEGKNKGVNGTPTFFINGTQLDNNQLSTLDSFSAIIDAEIAKSATTSETTQPNSTDTSDAANQ